MEEHVIYYRYNDGSGVGRMTSTDPTTLSYPVNTTPCSREEYEEGVAEMERRQMLAAIQAAYDAELVRYANYQILLGYSIPDPVARTITGYTGPADGPVMPPELEEPPVQG